MLNIHLRLLGNLNLTTHFDTDVIRNTFINYVSCNSSFSNYVLTHLVRTHNSFRPAHLIKPFDCLHCRR